MFPIEDLMGDGGCIATTGGSRLICIAIFTHAISWTDELALSSLTFTLRHRKVEVGCQHCIGFFVWHFCSVNPSITRGGMGPLDAKAKLGSLVCDSEVFVNMIM
jgi:hypothetical protein